MKKDMDKSKPQFYQSSTIIVYFRHGSSVDSVLEEHGLDGVLVSYFLNQWAVEVPHGREVEYIERLNKLDSITEVNEHFLEGEKKFFRRKRRFDD